MPEPTPNPARVIARDRARSDYDRERTARSMDRYDGERDATRADLALWEEAGALCRAILRRATAGDERADRLFTATRRREIRRESAYYRACYRWRASHR